MPTCKVLFHGEISNTLNIRTIESTRKAVLRRDTSLRDVGVAGSNSVTPTNDSSDVFRRDSRKIRVTVPVSHCRSLLRSDFSGPAFLLTQQLVNRGFRQDFDERIHGLSLALFGFAVALSVQ